MKIKYPKGDYFTIREFSLLNKFSHRKAERILNDLVEIKLLIKTLPKYDKKVKYWFQRK